MRGHCAVGFQQVESREEGGEGSAWTLCSGLPKVGRREKREEGSAWTLCSGRPKVGSREKGGEGSAWTLCSGRPLSAPKRASHALLSPPSSPIPTLQARPSAPATHCFLFPHPFSLPYKRAQALQPRTAFSSLIPSPYLTGAPKRASHALLSLPSSPIPTLQARPSAPATHCFLFPLPFSLPYRRVQARQPRTAFSSLIPNL